MERTRELGHPSIPIVPETSGLEHPSIVKAHPRVHFKSSFAEDPHYLDGILVFPLGHIPSDVLFGAFLTRHQTLVKNPVALAPLPIFPSLPTMWLMAAGPQPLTLSQTGHKMADFKGRAHKPTSPSQ